MKSREQIHDYLRSVGIEPDTRQNGRLIAFATFAVVNEADQRELGEICGALRDYFIANVTNYPYSSSLIQITYSPILSDIYPTVKDLQISYARSEKTVHIWARLNEHSWQHSDAAQRRDLVVACLVAALPRIRKSWLSPTDGESLVQLFNNFVAAATNQKPSLRDGEA